MVSSFAYGLNAPATDFDGKNKYLRITDIDDNTREFLHTDLTSPKANFSEMNDYLLQDGDILFARTGASVGKTYKYRDSDGKVYYAGFLIRARLTPGYDSEFVFQNTLTDKFKKFVRITSQRSGQPGINAKEYSEYEMTVPSLSEQQKIGQLFIRIDDLLSLHQRSSCLGNNILGGNEK